MFAPVEIQLSKEIKMKKEYYKRQERLKKISKRVIEVANKSPCKKRKVGAIIVQETPTDFIEFASGWNNPTDGEICELPDGTTKAEVIHAEIHCINNLLHKEKKYRNYSELKMYISHYPCDSCKKELEEHNISFEVVESFMKFDKEKPRMTLVPPSLGLAAARALTYGAKKYKPNNWRKTDNIECYINALQRHFDAWRSGEDNDPESRLNHLDHMAANVSFLIELKHLPKIKLNDQE